MTYSNWIRIAFLWLALGVSSAAVLDRIAVTVGNDAITESEVMEEIRMTSFMNDEALDFSPAARHAAADRLVDQYLIRHELEAGSYPSPNETQATKLIADFIKTHFPGRAEFEKKLKQYGITEQDLASHLRFQLQAIQFTDLRFATASSNEADRAATPPARTSATGTRPAEAPLIGTPTAETSTGSRASAPHTAETPATGTAATSPSKAGTVATGTPAAAPYTAGTPATGTPSAAAFTAGTPGPPTTSSSTARPAATRTPTAETSAPSPTDPAAATKVDQQLDDWLKQVRAQTRIEFKKEAFE